MTSGLKNHFAALVGILFIAFLICWPLFRPGFFVSDDGDWMIIRLSAFYQSFREGQFPVRFLGRLNQSYGYPVSNFLYPGYLYLGSFLHAAGIPFVATVKIILGASVVICGIASYFWLLIFYSRLPSLIGAISIMSAPYLLFDIYKRGSIGEVLAIAVFSVVLALWERKKWFASSIAIGFLIISHNTLALFFLLLFVLYGLSRTKKIRDLWPVVGGIGISTFFWLPAIFERKYVLFDHISVSNPLEYFMPRVGWNLINITFILAFFGSLFLLKRSRIKILFVSLFLAIAFLVTPLSSFLWNKSLLATLVQFPYRLLSVSLFLGGFFVAGVISELKETQKILLSILAVIGVFCSIYLGTKNSIPTNKPESFYTTNEATTTVANEYMPYWVREPAPERATGRIEFFKGKGILQMKLQSTQRVEGTIIAEENSIVQVNSIFYPGWGITLDGLPTTIQYNNPRGVMRIDVPKGTHSFLAEFHETVLRFSANCISVIAFIIVSLISVPFFRSLHVEQYLFSNENPKKTISRHNKKKKSQ